MSAEIANVSGDVLTLKIGGMLTHSELVAAHSAEAGVIRAGGKLSQLAAARAWPASN